MRTPIHKKVKFQGQEYWLHETMYGYNISPLNHYTENGELLVESISYAFMLDDGTIMRFLEVIGTKEDLEIVK